MRFVRTYVGPPAAAAVTWAAASCAYADSPVEIAGVDNGLRGEARDVLPDRDPPETGFDAQRLSSEAATRVRAYLRAEGYYAAAVEIEPDEDPPKARIVVDSGPRFALAAPALAFSADPPDADAQKAANAALGVLQPGKPARAQDVLNAEAAAVAALRANGYPAAKPGPRRVVVDHATITMQASYTLESGQKVRLGAIRLANESVLRRSYADNLGDWSRGDQYDPQKLTDVRRGLSSTGAFAIVNADLAPEANPDGTRDVVLALEPAEPRVLELGAGWSSSDGVGVEASWTKRNVTRRADSLEISTVVAEQQQSLFAALTRPNAIGPGRSLTLSVGLANDNSAAFERNGFSAAATIDDTRRRGAGFSYGVAAAADYYNEDVGPENAYTIGAFLEARRDETDSLFDARRGYSLRARIEPAVSFGDADTTFIRSTGEGRGYYTPESFERLTLALRTAVGWIEPLSGADEDLPLDRRFFAGGGGSVRGYEYNSIFPERVTRETAIGGLGLFEVSAEARGRITERFGAAAFLDGGSAFNAFGRAADDVRWGAGVGVRYNLGFAPLRVDLAVPLDKRAQDQDYALYVSIGQAF